MGKQRSRGIRCLITGKKRFPSEWAALKRANSFPLARGHTPMNAYHCPHCREWHIGHLQRSRIVAGDPLEKRR